MSASTFGGDDPQEYAVGQRLVAPDGRTAEVVSVRCANRTYGVWMATLHFAGGELLSLPYSNVRRDYTTAPAQ